MAVSQETQSSPSSRAMGFAPRLHPAVNIWSRISNKCNNNAISKRDRQIQTGEPQRRLSRHRRFSTLTDVWNWQQLKMPMNSDLSRTISSVMKSRGTGVTTATRAKKWPANSDKICSSSSQIQDFFDSDMCMIPLLGCTLLMLLLLQTRLKTADSETVHFLKNRWHFNWSPFRRALIFSTELNLSEMSCTEICRAD